MRRIDFIGTRNEEVRNFYKKTETSTEFHYAFTNSGTIVASCELCGRTYFNSTDHGFEEGELEGLVAKSNEFPDKYYDCDYSIAPVYFAGLGHTVMGCACGASKFVEDFIWAHRQNIAQYLNERRQIEFTHAESDFEKTKVNEGKEDGKD